MNGERSRRFLSQEMCRRWNWIQPNGILKDMICPGLLLQLEVQGFLKLPQGDGLTEPDGCIPRENILGRVTAITRCGRRVRFGLGPERFAIALANRWGALREIARFDWRTTRPLLRGCRHRPSILERIMAWMN